MTFPDMPFDKTPGPTYAEILSIMQDRILAIEARQRAYGQHDPSCPTRPGNGHIPTREELMAVRPGPICDCWLSR